MNWPMSHNCHMVRGTPSQVRGIAGQKGPRPTISAPLVRGLKRISSHISGNGIILSHNIRPIGQGIETKHKERQACIHDNPTISAPLVRGLKPQDRLKRHDLAPVPTISAPLVRGLKPGRVSENVRATSGPTISAPLVRGLKQEELMHLIRLAMASPQYPPHWSGD